jgi:hypothetical protein
MTVHMKPVRLAFATTPSVVRWLLGDATGSRVLAALVLLSSVAGLCTVAWTLRGTQQQLRSAQNGMLTLVAQRGAVRQGASRDAKPAPTLQQSREWNQIVRQLNTPWPAILDTLERTTPETVALVAIEPDARNASVRLQVEAKTLDTLLAYAGSLQGAGPFDDVVLRKHETNEQDANRPMRLSFDARLKAGKGDSVPPAGGER